jgi:hypothetical protein
MAAESLRAADVDGESAAGGCCLPSHVMDNFGHRKEFVAAQSVARGVPCLAQPVFSSILPPLQDEVTSNQEPPKEASDFSES